MKINVVGLGGIGSCLINVLARVLAYTPQETKLVLIDGDTYEPDNKRRQKFSELTNKAEATASLLQTEFPASEFAQLIVIPIAEYLTVKNHIRLIREGDITLLCVDNHLTRKLAAERLGKLKNGVLISGGCAWEDGEVLVYVRREGKDVTLPLTSDFHKEIQNAAPESWQPHNPGCEEIAPSQPQLLITNNFVAACMLSAFYSVIQNENIRYDEVTCDILTTRVTPNDRLHRFGVNTLSKVVKGEEQ